MNLLPSLIFASLVATADARTIVVEFMLPPGEVADMKAGGKNLGHALEPGPHRVVLKDRQEATMEIIREMRYPIEFNPAQVTDIEAAAKGKGGIEPQVPARFETTNAGWAFSIVPQETGNTITLVGKATYTAVDLQQAAHGEGAGPIMREFTDKKGRKKQVLLSPNVAQSAISQTTATNFQLYATPGKRYDIPVRRGDKTVKIAVICFYKE
jgi:hypothetical protein